MAQYATVRDVTAKLKGAWDTQDDRELSSVITALSRMFDHETRRADDFWATLPGGVPPDVAYAVAVWAAYEWKASQAGYSNIAQRLEQPGGMIYSKGIPSETQRVIDYYSETYTQPVSGQIGSTVRNGIVTAPSPFPELRWPGYRTR